MDRLLNIQVLRALAALFVVVFHSGLEMTRLGERFGHEPAFDHGRFSLGISLFFAISGFIMVVTCRDAFGAPGAALAFVRRRLVRIVPIYWLLTLMVAVLALVAPALAPSADGPLALPLSMLFWPFARANGEVRPLVTPGWTLNLEAWFYAVFACGLLFRRTVGLSVIVGVIGGLSLLRMNGAFSSVPLNFWGDPIVLGFILGMGVGLAYLKGARLPLPLAAALLILGIGISLTGGVREPPEDALLARLSVALPACLVLIGAALGPQIGGDSRVWRPLVFLGDASYSLYLVHEFALRPLRLAWERAIGDALSMPLFLVVGIAVSIAAGVASYLLLERPMGRWLKGGARSERGSAEPVALRPGEPYRPPHVGV